MGRATLESLESLESLQRSDGAHAAHGMADIDDDDFFTDDDLDALPANALEDLEQKAFESTQQRAVNAHATSLHSHHTTDKFNALSRDQASLQPPHRQPHAGQSGLHGRYQPQEPSSDYGEFEDEALEAGFLDAAEPVREAPAPFVGGNIGDVNQREQWPQLRDAGNENHQVLQPQQGYPTPHQLRGNHQHHLKDSGFFQDYDARPLDERPNALDTLDQRQGEEPVELHNEEVSLLQAQLQELLEERDALHRDLEAANSTALKSAGEIAIVRANQAKATKEYEQKLLALQKLHADEAEKQKEAIFEARQAREKVKTENQFLKQDLAEDKLFRKTAKDNGSKSALTKSAGNVSPFTTPKKAKPLAYRDGFDDDEITIVSPSKVGGRSKPVTPRAGAKRKRRTVDDSPVKELQFTQPRIDNEKQVLSQHSVGVRDEGWLQQASRDDGRFEFVRDMLVHRPRDDHEQTFEAFTKYSFPSNPALSFSSIILTKMSALDAKKDIENFRAAFCEIFMSIWSQCLFEKYYSPLYLILDLLQFALVIDTSSTIPYILNDLVVLIQRTIDVKAVPRFHGAYHPPPTAGNNNPNDEKRNYNYVNCEIHPDSGCIIVNDYMVFLQMIATSCLHNEAYIRRFWQLMRHDFILMMLHTHQLISDVQLNLRILSTSSLSMTLGPILGGPEADDSIQALNERYIISRFTGLLIEPPFAAIGEEPYDEIQIKRLRIDVLGVIGSICKTEHGSQAVALHSHVIGRLVKTMHDELDVLYDHRAGYELSANLTTLSTLLLYHLLIPAPHNAAYHHLIDLQARLALVPGGQHKYLVALTRLAFSEGMVLDKDIDIRVVDAAHRLLEERVTPEEGDALDDVFGGSVGRNRGG
ncbi:MAG: hypothetical protein M1819_000511 [Sarea resinae]|nr:MAG: hypothetical protein M1819_000511 [Sarea resinae]